jgi:hypothetical protein
MIQLFKRFKLALPLMGLLSLFCGGASASDIYVAQAAAGANSGVDCADAHPVAWFNTASNWGYGTSQIGPGTTVHLCGTISSPISAQLGGTSGSPIVIAFDCASRGQLSMPAIPATGVLTVSGLSYITVDGQGCGIIQSTNNGQSGFANSVGSQAILATNSTNIEIKNLTCGPLYLHNTTATTSFGAPYPVCVNFTGSSSSNITIDHNMFTDCAWCAWGQGNTVSFNNNTCVNFDHCLGMGNTNTTPTIWGPVYFYNNSMSNAVTWDTGSTGQYHHDGLHLWGYCSDGGSYCAGTYWNNVYVYNNHFYGNWGPINTTAFVFFEENIHNAWVFNNWADCTQAGNECDSAALYLQGTNISSYNNTIVGSGTSQPTALLFHGGPNITARNNVISTASVLINIASVDESGQNPTTISALSNNIYMNGLANPWVWKGTFISSLAMWQTDAGETNSSYSSSSTVSLPTGTLQGGSPAIGSGANLYGICNGQPNPGLGALCYDAIGSPRPSSGAWDAGAFLVSGGNNSLQPPSSITAVAR